MIRALLFILGILGMLHAGGTMRIATYNVENLFDLHRDGHEYAEYIPYTKWRWNRTNYRKKLRNVARVIAGMRPDIVGLEEIESRTALRDLQAELKRQGLYLPHLAIADAKGTTVKAALLSRIRIRAKREVWVTRGYKYRNILETQLRIGGETLYVFVNHWKSKSGPESMRVASARALKKRLNALGNVNYVLLGDFNSDYDEKHLFVRRRKHNDTHGITGIDDILKTMIDGRFVTCDDLKRCRDCACNLWLELPESERWTHVFRGSKEALDSIIVSPKLVDGRGLEYRRGSFTRYMPQWLMTKKGTPYRWQRSRGYPKHHTGKGYSDHLPIYADFAW